MRSRDRQHGFYRHADLHASTFKKNSPQRTQRTQRQGKAEEGNPRDLPFLCLSSVFSVFSVVNSFRRPKLSFGPLGFKCYLAAAHFSFMKRSPCV